MLFGLTNRAPLLEADYAHWLFDVYAWALRNFDPIMFRDETVLVTPTNRHFPGRANNPDEMARLIFERTVAHAGMAHWPLQLLPPGSCALEPPQQLQLPSASRGSRALTATAPEQGLPFSYDPNSVNSPEAMIALFAHGLAHYLGQSASEPPPGGSENWPIVTELLAVFMGFGLMFANTALVIPKGGCCGGPTVRRQAYVSQHDITYALAIFAALKGLPPKDVLEHLKKSLRGHFKRAYKEVTGQYGERVRELRESHLT